MGKDCRLSCWLEAHPDTQVLQLLLASDQHQAAGEARQKQERKHSFLWRYTGQRLTDQSWWNLADEQQGPQSEPLLQPSAIAQPASKGPPLSLRFFSGSETNPLLRQGFFEESLSTHALAELSRNHKQSGILRAASHREFRDCKCNHSLTVFSSTPYCPQCHTSSALFQLRVSSVGPCSSTIMSQDPQNLTETSLCVMFTLLWQLRHTCRTFAHIPLLPSALENSKLNSKLKL